MRYVGAKGVWRVTKILNCACGEKICDIRKLISEGETYRWGIISCPCSDFQTEFPKSNRAVGASSGDNIPNATETWNNLMEKFGVKEGQCNQEQESKPG